MREKACESSLSHVISLEDKSQVCLLSVLLRESALIVCILTGDDATIRKFLASKNVKFDVYDKIDVNGKLRSISFKFITIFFQLGDNAHPIYKWLKSKLKGILYTEAIKWNFTK